MIFRRSSGGLWEVFGMSLGLRGPYFFVTLIPEVAITCSECTSFSGGVRPWVSQWKSKRNCRLAQWGQKKRTAFEPTAVFDIRSNTGRQEATQAKPDSDPSTFRMCLCSGGVRTCSGRVRRCPGRFRMFSGRLWMIYPISMFLIHF